MCLAVGNTFSYAFVYVYVVFFLGVLIIQLLLRKTCRPTYFHGAHTSVDCGSEYGRQTGKTFVNTVCRRSDTSGSRSHAGRSRRLAIATD